MRSARLGRVGCGESTEGHCDRWAGVASAINSWCVAAVGVEFMGTTIDIFTPRVVVPRVAEVREALSELTRLYAPELETLTPPWRPTATSWWVSESPEAPHVYGEGPVANFHVYAQVMDFSIIHRFFMLYDPSRSFLHSAGETETDGARRVQALHRLIPGIARVFGDGRHAVVAGGFGDSDHAGDLAHSGESFDSVCRHLTTSLGPPTSHWPELADVSWYLGRP
jgi:hypothetical protein